MKYTVSFSCLPEEEKNETLLRKKAVKELRKNGVSLAENEISAFVFRKKSIDARKRDVKFFLRYDIYTDGDSPENDEEYVFVPRWKKCDDNGKSVIIIGAGPAGLFLSRHGAP